MTDKQIVNPVRPPRRGFGEFQGFAASLIGSCEVPADPNGDVRARGPGAVGCHRALGGAAPSCPGGRLRGRPGVEAGHPTAIFD